MASFGCYDNSDVIATRIITNFHLYLIQLWWQFFQMIVHGVVVHAQKKLHRHWPWKTVSSHFHMLVWPMLLHHMALVSVRLYCKNLGNLQQFFGQMVYRPPKQKIARTPMYMANLFYYSMYLVNQCFHAKEGFYYSIVQVIKVILNFQWFWYKSHVCIRFINVDFMQIDSFTVHSSRFTCFIL